MPEIGVREYPLCPEGVDIFRLKEVERKDMPSYDGTGTTERLIWKFVSRQQTESGEFYEVSLFTPCYYTGHPKSKLTWLMRWLDKRVTKDWIKANKLNTDEYVGRDYEALIQHTVSEDGSKTYATFAYLKPLVDKASTPEAPIVPPMDPADPFVFDGAGDTEACKVCSKALTDAEVAGCVKRWKGDAYYCTDHARQAMQREAEEAADLFAAA